MENLMYFECVLDFKKLSGITGLEMLDLKKMIETTTKRRVMSWKQFRLATEKELKTMAKKLGIRNIKNSGADVMFN